MIGQEKGRAVSDAGEPTRQYRSVFISDVHLGTRASQAIALLDFLAHYTVYPRADLEAVVEEAARRHGLTYEFRRLHRGYTEYAVLRRA